MHSGGLPIRQSHGPRPDHDTQRGDLGPKVGSVNAQRLCRLDLIHRGVAEDPGEQVPLRQSERLDVEVLRTFLQSQLEELPQVDRSTASEGDAGAAMVVARDSGAAIAVMLIPTRFAAH
jgi:hypothetical protein